MLQLPAFLAPMAPHHPEEAERMACALVQRFRWAGAMVVSQHHQRRRDARQPQVASREKIRRDIEELFRFHVPDLAVHERLDKLIDVGDAEFGSREHVEQLASFVVAQMQEHPSLAPALAHVSLVLHDYIPVLVHDSNKVRAIFGIVCLRHAHLKWFVNAPH
jgi:hypothetical protein